MINVYYGEDINKKVCTIQNYECQENYICNFKESLCVESEKCPKVKSEFCITLYEPVCSNGKEYSNSCVACANGVEKYYKGKC